MVRKIQKSESTVGEKNMETIHMENDIKNEYSDEQLNSNLESNFFIPTSILRCGVSIHSKVLHLGSGYKNSVLFKYFNELKLRDIVDFQTFEYTGVDVNSIDIDVINELNEKNKTLKNFSSFDKSAQIFLDEYAEHYDWTIITGLFDKYVYGFELQFEFIDKLLSKCMSISSEGVVFTFDSSKEIQNEKYRPIDIISRIEDRTDTYSVSKITKQDYVFCIKHSL